MSEYRTSWYEITRVHDNGSEGEIMSAATGWRQPVKIHTRIEADKYAQELANESGRPHKVYLVAQSQHRVSTVEPEEENE